MTDRAINFVVTLYRGTKSSWKKYHLLIPPRLWKKYILLLLGFRPERQDLFNPFNKKHYNLWLKENPETEEVKALAYNPLISVIIPVYNVDPRYLNACIESILSQSYQNFEICIVDDASSRSDTIEALQAYKNNPKIHIKFRRKNGHISRASNDALKMAKGTFIALMDNDDLLPKNALYEIAKKLNDDKKLDFIYTDEDKLDSAGKRCEPNFKPDFSPDTLMSYNYISHLAVLRKSLVDKVGGFRIGLEGAQDYDLYLRVLEKTKRIFHIPKILYHWRMIDGSTAKKTTSKNYAIEKGKIALEDALKRRGEKGKVSFAKDCPYYYVEYEPVGNPKVSIIIPMKDLAKVTKRCIKSIYKKTTYQNFEVVVVNNNSVEKRTFKMLDKFKRQYRNFRVIDANMEFNYSVINNLAVSQTKSDYILLLNNDVKVITNNWLERMLGYAMQKHIGAVGAKLLYPNDTIQHAGVVLGIGVASHVFLEQPRRAIIWGGRLSVPLNYSAVTGACLMVSRKKWNEVHGLEEQLKVAYNDIDFCLKLLDKGYYNVILPIVELYHYESKSRGYDTSGEKKKRFDAEQLFMRKKWKKRIDNDEFYNPNFTKQYWYLLDRKNHKGALQK